jgi:hypothetical protein
MLFNNNVSSSITLPSELVEIAPQSPSWLWGFFFL